MILLVEEGLEDNDFIPRLDETHKGTQHALICTGSDGDLRVWVDISAEQGRICFRDCFLQPWSSLSFCKLTVSCRRTVFADPRWRVLIAIDPVKGFLGGIGDEFGWVIATSSVSCFSSAAGLGSFIRTKTPVPY